MHTKPKVMRQANLNQLRKEHIFSHGLVNRLIVFSRHPNNKENFYDIFVVRNLKENQSNLQEKEITIKNVVWMLEKILKLNRSEPEN